VSGPDHSAFRHALAQFPTGVTVVIGQSPSRKTPVGLTVSSFNSVSLSPPLVLWSISSHSQHLDAFAVGQAHRIHVLAHNQQELALRFAQSGRDKFEGIPLRYGQRPADEQTMQSGQAKAPAFAPPCEAISLESVPLLAHCSARFDCITDVIHSAGDHCVVIARVLYFEASDHEPLIFAQGGFFGLSKR